MKTKMLFIFSLMLSTALLSNSSFATTNSFHKSGVSTDTIIVPEPVRVSFQTKYPQATRVVWYRYQDMQDDYTDTYPGYYDPSDYYVVYQLNNTDYVTWYNPSGEWVMTTNTIQSDKLPAAALKVLQDSYNGYQVVKVDEDHYSGGTRYDVKLKKGDEKIKVHVTADGQILKLKSKQ